MTEINEVLQERCSRFGIFSEHARITQEIKRAMTRSANWERLSLDKRESLEMIAHKIGRILNGDPEYLDSWVDIIGYAQLIVKALEKAAENPLNDPAIQRVRKVL